MGSDPTGESVVLVATLFGAAAGAISGAVAAYGSGGNILAGAVTGAIAGGACGAIGVAKVGLLAGSLLCAGVGAITDFSNQLINGVKWDSIDYGSVATSAVTSALSFGLGRGIGDLMQDSGAAAQFVSSIKSVGMSLCATGLYNTYGSGSQTVGSSTVSQADLEHWQRMTEHYRGQMVRSGR